ncbi:MAG: hypothetical protein HY718_04915 [Planctomycetes bacterium]|nr:hypothetical protein [Planctomycetota bacterium]
MGDASEDVVRTTACVLSSLRRTLESQKYLEVIIPVLRASRPSSFVEPLRVTLGDERVATRTGVVKRPETHAQLSSVPGGYLQALLPRVGNVYTVAPMFRGELIPTWLTEFRYVQVVGRGGIEDAIKLGVTLVGNALQAMEKERLAVSEQAKAFGDPIRMSYADAMKQVGGRVGEPLSHDQYRDLAAANRNRPVIIMGVPLHLEPYGALGARTSRDGPAFFEMVVPEAGELGAGKEYESNTDAFWESTDGAAQRRAGLPWHDRRDLEVVEELLSTLPSPSFSFGMGFERLVQYALGKRDIGEAVAFPVVNGAALRPPLVME